MKGSLVFAGAMSHAPGIAAFRDAASKEQASSFFNACATMHQTLVASNPDVIVILAPDHFSNFFIDNMPAACVTLNATYHGPVEKWLGVSNLTVAGMPDLGRAILDRCYKDGIEPAFSEEAALEHSVIVPLSLLTPNYDVPIVWIMQNCQVPPLMSLERCYAFGRSIRQAVDDSGLRVAIVGSGGLSHAPGAPELQTLKPVFDRQFLSLLEKDDRRELLSIPDAVLDDAGFGSWEIRLWVVALGAAHERKARTLAYEAIVPWDTGCGVAIFE